MVKVRNLWQKSPMYRFLDTKGSNEQTRYRFYRRIKYLTTRTYLILAISADQTYWWKFDWKISRHVSTAIIKSLINPGVYELKRLRLLSIPNAFIPFEGMVGNEQESSGNAFYYPLDAWMRLRCFFCDTVHFFKTSGNH